jgi:NitT/TauT family transport system substrate-binding protein
MRKIALALTVLGIATGNSVAAESVKVGYTRTATDIALYVADKRGYFKAEGLNVSLVNMQSAAVMIVPMTSGDIDVMAGSASAGLYNAIARGLDIRLVASKVTTPKGYTSQTLIVRKDLYDSGKIRSVADLKGQKIANSGTGTAALGTMRRMLKTGGLTLKDIDMIALAFPQMRTAMENGAIVAALPAEPVTTQTVNAGVAVKLIKDDEAYPGHEIASFMYSSKLLKERREVGLKFMRALIRGARDHNDGLDDKGMFSGPKGDAIIAILNEYTPVKDPNFFKTFALAYCDPDGAISVDSLREDLELFKELGLIQGEASVEKLVDDSLRQQIVKELGPYKKAN